MKRITKIIAVNTIVLASVMAYKLNSASPQVSAVNSISLGVSMTRDDFESVERYIIKTPSQNFVLSKDTYFQRHQDMLVNVKDSCDAGGYCTNTVEIQQIDLAEGEYSIEAYDSLEAAVNGEFMAKNSIYFN